MFVVCGAEAGECSFILFAEFCFTMAYVVNNNNSNNNAIVICLKKTSELSCYGILYIKNLILLILFVRVCCL